MKKVFVVLVALVLLAPAIGLACDCCPKEVTPSQQTGFSNVAHNCCASVSFTQQNCETQKQIQVLPTSSQTKDFESLLNDSVLWTQIASAFVSPSVDTSPPPFTFKTPLYLANQVLRF